jgi:hypothetical protein
MLGSHPVAAPLRDFSERAVRPLHHIVYLSEFSLASDLTGDMTPPLLLAVHIASIHQPLSLEKRGSVMLCLACSTSAK